MVWRHTEPGCANLPSSLALICRASDIHVFARSQAPLCRAALHHGEWTSEDIPPTTSCPSRSCWLGSTARVHGSQPMEMYPHACSSFVGTPCTLGKFTCLAACHAPMQLNQVQMVAFQQSSDPSLLGDHPLGTMSMMCMREANSSFRGSQQWTELVLHQGSTLAPPA